MPSRRPRTSSSSTRTPRRTPRRRTSPGNFSKIGKEKGGKAKQTKEAAAEGAPSLEAVEAVCKAETERKGTASMLAIFSRLRRGSADADYIACMKERGYEVKP